MATKKKAVKNTAKLAKKPKKSGSVSKKSPAKKKDTAKTVNKKVSMAKKTAAKKVTAKKVTKKPATKKAVAKKVTTAKKTAKKAVTPKKTVKKSVKKSASTKKTTAKKPVKKTTAKKVTKKAITKKAVTNVPVDKGVETTKPSGHQASLSVKAAPKSVAKSDAKADKQVGSFSRSKISAAERAKGIAARKAAAKAKSAAIRKPEQIKKKATAKKLTKAQSKKYEAMLLRLRDELSRQIAFLRGTSLTRDDEVNVAEDGSDAFERQLALKLAANEGDAVFEIDEALHRLREQTYGQCEECGGLISPERLHALPFARRCMRCKSASESRGGGYQQRRFK